MQPIHLFTAASTRPSTLCLNPAALSLLSTSFHSCSSITPVLALGQPMLGKCSTLDSLLCELSQVRNEIISKDRSFEAMEKCEGAMDLWPEPIVCGGKNILLMKLSGVNLDEIDEEMEKIIHIAVSLATVCLYFSEREGMFRNLNTFLEIADEHERISQTSPTKWMIFAEKEGIFLKSPKLTSGLCELFARENANIFEFVFRGIAKLPSECSQQILQSFQYCDSFAVRNPRLSQISPISGFLEVLTALVGIANSNASVPQFLSAIPSFHSEVTAVDLKEIATAAQRTANTTAATTLMLFQKSSNLPRAAQEIINQITSTYDMRKPTVVLLLLGHQGQGKSTLLNRMIKHCTRSTSEISTFVAKSTQEHTTRDSQILSQPAFIPGTGTQLMLIDQEGLLGIELKSPKEFLAQISLISHTTTLASVPCILISNEIAKIAFAEEMVKRIAAVNADAGLTVERIFFMFHDKDFGGKCDNEAIRNVVTHLNCQFFYGREVILLVNKPSMVDSKKREMQEAFLNFVLSEADYPKKSVSGEIVNVADLMSELTLVSCPFGKYKADVRAEGQKISAYQCALLDKYANQLSVSQPDASVVSLLSEYHRKLTTEIRQALTAVSEELSNFVLAMVEKRAVTLKMILLRIESCFQTIRDGHNNRLLNISVLLSTHKSKSEAQSTIQKTVKVYPLAQAMWESKGKHTPNLLSATGAAVALLTRTGFLFSRSWVLNPAIPPLIAQYPTTIILTVGVSDASLSTFNTEFIRTVLPLTSSKIPLFTSDEPTQFFPFLYFRCNATLGHPYSRDVAQGLLISVQIPTDTSTEKSQHIANIAWALLGKSSVVCLVVNVNGRSNHCIEQILEASISTDDSTPVAYRKQKVTIVLSNVSDSQSEKLAQQFAEQRLLPEVKKVESVNQECVFAGVHSLRREMMNAGTMHWETAMAILGDVVREANGMGTS